MKKIHCLLLLLLPVYCLGQADFITTFKTDNPGTSSNTSIILPCMSASGYQVDFNNDGDLLDPGESTVHTTGFTHDFGAVGTYTIRIVGNLDRILFIDSEDPEKILSVDQWGTSSVWSNMEDAFNGCANLSVPATDAPNLSSCGNMTRMFKGAANFNEPVGHWDVSNILLMTDLFRRASSFNQPLNAWDVSNVTWADFMFAFATSFNQPLDAWDITSLRVMSNMFRSATSFNQPLDAWDVSSATHLGSMFRDATSFNQPLGTWDVTGSVGLASMFRDASSFNQPLSTWNVAGVTSMNSMFWGATSFNQPLNSWNVSSVTNMSNMFRDASSFNQPLNGWNVSSVTNMSTLFRNASSFDQPLHSWNVSGVTNMSNMFFGTSSFNQPLNAWNVSSVTNMTTMFREASIFDQPLPSWNVSGVSNMSNMFRDASSFDQPLHSWNVSGVSNMSSMFLGATSFNQPLSAWDISSVTNMSSMLNSSGLDCFNYDSTLVGWEAQAVSGLSLGATNLFYDNALAARNSLISTHGWTISGDNHGGGCGTLPVEILGFDAQINDNVVHLFWETARETNNDYFAVQRSDDGIIWENVLEVEGAGNSTTVLPYRAEDSEPLIGTSFYRLQQHDFDGASSESPVVAIHNSGLSSFQVYPNPTNGVVNIAIAGSEEVFNYEVIDLQGKVILSVAASSGKSGSAVFSLEDYPSGVYLIRLFNEKRVKMIRMIKE